MRISNVVFCVVVAVLALGFLSACSDNPNPNKPGADSYQVTVKIQPPTCVGVDPKVNGWCDRTAVPIKVWADWGDGYKYSGVEVTNLGNNTFEVKLNAPTGRRLPIHYTDPGLCEVGKNCTNGNSGIGLTVQGTRLNDGPSETSFELTRMGEVIR